MESFHFIMVFAEGLISFFSPCVMPILPLYFSYLSGNAKETNADGTIYYKQSKIFIYTIFFVLGICFSFFLLGLSVSILGHFFDRSKYIIAILSGILILFFGLSQLGVFKIPFLQQEKKLHKKIDLNHLSLLATFILGFTFSFAWTPCVGPILSSVLLLVANASMLEGFFYLLLYAIGFLVPFLIIGLFTTPTLNFLKRKQKVLKYTIQIAGVILLVIGINLIYQNGKSFVESFESRAVDQIYTVSFQDQFQKQHQLSNYQGKIVVLSFLDRFCSGCKEEIPLIENLYQKYQNKEVVFLGVMKMNASDTKEEMEKYLKERKYSFPVLIDAESTLAKNYQVTNYPMTYILDQKGKTASHILGTFFIEQIEKEIRKLDEKAFCEKETC